jgi:hypothetical protein
MSALGVGVVYESVELTDLGNLRDPHIEDCPSRDQVLMKIPPK